MPNDSVDYKLSRLPESFRERWKEARPHPDGRREVAHEFAGLSGVILLSLPDFLEHAEMEITEWHKGNYRVCEAAQILADANEEVDAVDLCKRMQSAINRGELVLRRSGIPLVGEEIPQGAVYYETVRLTDVNNWLVKIDAGFKLENPYPDYFAAMSQSNGIDTSLLCTSEELIAAFGRFTGMTQAWFDNLGDRGPLKRARKVIGTGGKRPMKPLFCPVEVMQYLIESIRSSHRLSPEKGWELLEKNFPKVYSAKSAGDPRN